MRPNGWIKLINCAQDTIREQKQIKYKKDKSIWAMPLYDFQKFKLRCMLKYIFSLQKLQIW